MIRPAAQTEMVAEVETVAEAAVAETAVVLGAVAEADSEIEAEDDFA